VDEEKERERDDSSAEAIEDLEVEPEAAEDVSGGLSPPSPPSGPVPIPYPNTR
jgi:hypothetical protein